jgi:hypothetical protein
MNGLRKIIREAVSTEFSNDGHGGFESQTKSDLMGYYHGSGPLHQGEQPGDMGTHIYFGSKGGKNQAGEQSDAASKSGGKEQVETGLEENESNIPPANPLLKYIFKYQKAAREVGSKNSLFQKLMDFEDSKNLEVKDIEDFNVIVKSGKFNGKPVTIELTGIYTLDMAHEEIIDDLKMEVKVSGELAETLVDDDAYTFLSKL